MFGDNFNASTFFKEVHVSATIFLKLQEIASISYYEILILESLKLLMVRIVSQCFLFMPDLA